MDEQLRLARQALGRARPAEDIAVSIFDGDTVVGFGLAMILAGIALALVLLKGKRS